MAKPDKQATPRTRVTAPLPEGFEQKVSAELPPAWDFKKSAVLTGTVQSIQMVTLEDLRGVRKSRVAHVANKAGIFGLWESATLAPLFADLKTGDNVFVRYEGEGEAKPGRNAPKLFTAGIQFHS